MPTYDRIDGRNPVIDQLIRRTARQLYLVYENDARDLELLVSLKRLARALWGAASASFENHPTTGEPRASLDRTQSALGGFVTACQQAEEHCRAGDPVATQELRRTFGEFVHWYEQFNRMERRQLVESMLARRSA